MNDIPPPTDELPIKAASALPEVRAVTLSDLQFALAQGWTDFVTAPKYGLFFGAVFAFGGLLLIAAVAWLNMAWLAYPLVIGFSLIGPFIAAGLYEVSRRLERNAALYWDSVLGVVWAQQRREMGWMAFVTLFIFWIWIYQVRTLTAVFFGSKGFASPERLLEAIFTTSNGWAFLAAGHVVGAVLAMVLFTLTVVSCPLLLDRDLDFVSAMLTSIRAVFASPIVMFGWGVFVTLVVLASAVPAFLGLLVSLPVLGHATWHLYRRAVEPEPAT